MDLGISQIQKKKQRITMVTIKITAFITDITVF